MHPQIMESFDNTSSKVRYEIVGHSGEEAEIPLVMEVCVWGSVVALCLRAYAHLCRWLFSCEITSIA